MMVLSIDEFLEKGEEYSKLRKGAFESYSRAADLVRERLKELVEANREGKNQAMMDRLERELMAAERLKDLTVLEVQHADDNWREWTEEVASRREEERRLHEEARRLHEEERLTRQEKTTTSAKWAAWGSFFAALASAFVAAWQVFGPARHP